MEIDNRAWGRQATIDPLDGDALGAILNEAGARVGGGRADDPRRMERMVRLMDLMEMAGRSERHAMLLKETMTTSDFPLLFGDILDRQLIGQYQAWPVAWPSYARRGQVKDFRAVRRVGLDGLNGRWVPDFQNPEMTAVREGAVAERGYTYAVDVYQKAFSINWRMLVNDDLGAFTDLAERLTIGARRSEDYFATTLYVDANGPKSGVFSTGNGNLLNTAVYPDAVDDNPPLTVQSFNDARTILAMQTDPNTGEPILVDGVVLIVPPALQTTAEAIVDPNGFLRMGGFAASGGGFGGTADIGLDVRNRIGARTRIVVNPYIPIVSSSANGNTQWYLVADPNTGTSFLEIGFMRGFETPTLYQKVSDTMRLGGGIDQMMGDFETGELRYKGLHIFGGNVDATARGVVASNGSGS